MRVQTEDPGEFGHQIEVLVQAIRLAPADLQLHKDLRRASLQYKAVGGKAVGMFEWMRAEVPERVRRPKGDLVERLMSMERLWAMDPGNVDYPLRMQMILKEMERVGGYGEIEAVVRWVRAMVDGAREA